MGLFESSPTHCRGKNTSTVADDARCSDSLLSWLRSERWGGSGILGHIAYERSSPLKSKDPKGKTSKMGHPLNCVCFDDWCFQVLTEKLLLKPQVSSNPEQVCCKTLQTSRMNKYPIALWDMFTDLRRAHQSGPAADPFARTARGGIPLLRKKDREKDVGRPGWPRGPQWLRVACAF